MAGITTTQNLQYTTGGDLIVATGEAIADLAKRTEARLNQADRLLAMSQTPPFTVIESKTDKVFQRGYSYALDFDTVLVDTQDGADLSVDARLISMRKTGYWNVGAYVDIPNLSGAVTASGEVRIDSEGGVSGAQFGQSQYWASPSGLHLSLSTVCQVTNANTAQIFVVTSGNGLFSSSFTDTVTAGFRRMWAYWMGDL